MLGFREQYSDEVSNPDLDWVDQTVVVPAMNGGRSDEPLDLGEVALRPNPGHRPHPDKGVYERLAPRLRGNLAGPDINR